MKDDVQRVSMSPYLVQVNDASTILQLLARDNRAQSDCRYTTDIPVRDAVYSVCLVVALVGGSRL